MNSGQGLYRATITFARDQPLELRGGIRITAISGPYGDNYMEALSSAVAIALAEEDDEVCWEVDGGKIKSCCN
jgi:hypothetical protein